MAIRIAGLFLTAITIFTLGMLVNDWRRDSIQHHLDTLAEQNREQRQLFAQQISKSTHDAISAIRIEHRTIHTATLKEVIRDPIYLDCLVPVEGSQLINNARSRSSSDD